MIGTPASGTYFRLHTPRWAHQPTSGAGAARHGGRLNRPETEALYLAGDLQTAVAEFKQATPLLAPATIVSYSVLLSRVADFSKGFDPTRWPPIWEEFFCDWRKLVLDRIEPPSWVISDRVLAAGFQGVLFPSAANPGGTNLVVYTARLTASDSLVANDPHGDLPKNQSSWPPASP